MKRITSVLIFLGLLLGACDESMMLPEFTPTPAATHSPTLVDPVERATVDAHSETQAAQTQVALDVAAMEAQFHLESLRSSQTAVVGSTQAVATALSIQMTEQSAQITRQAEATSTERAWMAQGWTATADASIATATAQAGQAMLSAWATQTERAILASETQVAATATAAQVAFAYRATEDAPYLAANATAVAAQAVEAEAAADRIRITNQFLAWWPFWAPALGLTLATLLVFIGYQTWSRNRTIQRDTRGASPVVILDGEVINPDTMVYPRLSQGDQVSEETQAQIAESNLKVSAVRALPANDGSTARRMVSRLAAGGEVQHRFKVLSPEDGLARRLLPQGVAKAIDSDWREVDGE